MTRVFADKFSFFSREDKTENGVSKEFAEENPNWEEGNKYNKGCWNCSDCSRCSHIAQLRLKDDINPISTAENPVKGFPDIPLIENIHQKVEEAVCAPDAFDMSTWHSCETKHCRAGWVVNLAGEPGRILEKETSTQFAARQIYKASSPIRVSPVRFFETDEVAMADIKRCAAEEKASVISQ